MDSSTPRDDDLVLDPGIDSGADASDVHERLGRVKRAFFGNPQFDRAFPYDEAVAWCDYTLPSLVKRRLFVRTGRAAPRM